jgi:hypothetical protein
MKEMDRMMGSMVWAHSPSPEVMERVKRGILRQEREQAVPVQNLFDMIFSTAFESFSEIYRTQLANL